MPNPLTNSPTAPAITGTLNEPLALLALVVTLFAGMLLVSLVLRHRRARERPDAEPIVEILEPADEAAETVGVGERVRLRILLARPAPDSRLLVETPDGVVETLLEGRRAIVAFRVETTGEHDIHIRVERGDGTNLADETLPLHVIRYEDALDRPTSDRDEYLEELRGHHHPRFAGRSTPG